MHRCFSCLLFLALCLTGCDRHADVTTLQKETEYIHDEAMQDIAKMNRVSRLLKKDLAALDSLAPRRDSIVTLLAQMGQAEAGMMTWMREYEAPQPGAPDALNYLQAQKVLIEQNHRDICAALAAGEKLRSK